MTQPSGAGRDQSAGRHKRVRRDKSAGPEGPGVERILAAAEQCFRSAGYSAITLREIAERAEVSKSLLLYHFESKEHLFAELQLRIYGRLAESVTRAVSVSGGAPVERAATALDVLMAGVQSGNDLTVHALLSARALSNPAVAPHVRRMRRELKTLLHRTMREIFGQDVHLPLSLEAAADLLWAALTGLGMQSVLDESKEDLERGFSSLRTIVARAFAAEGEAQELGENTEGLA